MQIGDDFILEQDFDDIYQNKVYTTENDKRIINENKRQVFGKFFFVGDETTSLENLRILPNVSLMNILNNAVALKKWVIIIYPFDVPNLIFNYDEKQFFTAKIKNSENLKFIESLDEYFDFKDGKKFEDGIKKFVEQTTYFDIDTSEDVNVQHQKFRKIGISSKPKVSVRVSLKNMAIEGSYKPGVYILFTDFYRFWNIFQERYNIPSPGVENGLKEVFKKGTSIKIEKSPLELLNFYIVNYIEDVIIPPDFEELNPQPQLDKTPEFFIVIVPFIKAIFTRLYKYEQKLDSLGEKRLEFAVVPRSRDKIYKLFKDITDRNTYLMFKNMTKSFNNFNNSLYFGTISNRFDVAVKIGNFPDLQRFLRFYKYESFQIYSRINIIYKIITQYSFYTRDNWRIKFEVYKNMEINWVLKSLDINLGYIPFVKTKNMPMIYQNVINQYIKRGDRGFKPGSIKGNLIDTIYTFPIYLENILFDNLMFQQFSRGLIGEKYFDWLKRGASLSKEPSGFLYDKKIPLKNSIVNWLEYKFGIYLKQNKHVLFVNIRSKKEFKDKWISGKMSSIDKFMFFYQLYLTDNFIKMLKWPKRGLFPFLSGITNERFFDGSIVINKKKSIQNLNEWELDIKVEFNFLQRLMRFYKNIKNSFIEIKSYLKKDILNYFDGEITKVFNNVGTYTIIRKMLRLIGFIVVDYQNKQLIREVENLRSLKFSLIPVINPVKQFFKELEDEENIKKRYEKFINGVFRLLKNEYKELYKRGFNWRGPKPPSGDGGGNAFDDSFRFFKPFWGKPSDFFKRYFDGPPGDKPPGDDSPPEFQKWWKWYYPNFKDFKHSVDPMDIDDDPSGGFKRQWPRDPPPRKFKRSRPPRPMPRGDFKFFGGEVAFDLTGYTTPFMPPDESRIRIEKLKGKIIELEKRIENILGEDTPQYPPPPPPPDESRIRIEKLKGKIIELEKRIENILSEDVQPRYDPFLPPDESGIKIEELKGKIIGLKEEIKKGGVVSKKELDDIEKEKEILFEKNEQLEKEIDNMNQEMLGLKNLINSDQDNANKFRIRIKDLEVEIKKKKNLIDDQNNEIDILKSKSNELGSQITNLRIVNTRLRDTIENLKIEIENLKIEIGKAGNEIIKLQKRYKIVEDSDKDKANKLRIEIEGLELEIKNKQDLIYARNNTIKGLINESRNLGAVITNLNNNNTGLQRKLLKLKNEIVKLRNAKNKLKNDIIGLKNEISKLQKGYTLVVDSDKVKANNLRIKIEGLELEIKNKQDLIYNRDNTIKGLISESQKLGSQINKLRNYGNDVTLKLQLKKSEVERLINNEKELKKHEKGMILKLTLNKKEIEKLRKHEKKIISDATTIIAKEKEKLKKYDKNAKAIITEVQDLLTKGNREKKKMLRATAIMIEEKEKMKDSEKRAQARITEVQNLLAKRKTENDRVLEAYHKARAELNNLSFKVRERGAVITDLTITETVRNREIARLASYTTYDDIVKFFNSRIQIKSQLFAALTKISNELGQKITLDWLKVLIGLFKRYNIQITFTVEALIYLLISIKHGYERSPNLEIEFLIKLFEDGILNQNIIISISNAINQWILKKRRFPYVPSAPPDINRMFRGPPIPINNIDGTFNYIESLYRFIDPSLRSLKDHSFMDYILNGMRKAISPKISIGWLFNVLELFKNVFKLDKEALGYSINAIIGFFKMLKYKYPAFDMSFPQLKNYVAKNHKKIQSLLFYEIFQGGYSSNSEMKTHLKRYFKWSDDDFMKNYKLILKFFQEEVHHDSTWQYINNLIVLFSKTIGQVELNVFFMFITKCITKFRSYLYKPLNKPFFPSWEKLFRIKGIKTLILKIKDDIEMHLKVKKIDKFRIEYNQEDLLKLKKDIAETVIPQKGPKGVYQDFKRGAPYPDIFGTAYVDPDPERTVYGRGYDPVPSIISERTVYGRGYNPVPSIISERTELGGGYNPVPSVITEEGTELGGGLDIFSPPSVISEGTEIYDPLPEYDPFILTEEEKDIMGTKMKFIQIKTGGDFPVQPRKRYSIDKYVTLSKIISFISVNRIIIDKDRIKIGENVIIRSNDYGMRYFNKGYSDFIADFGSSFKSFLTSFASISGYPRYIADAILRNLMGPAFKTGEMLLFFKLYKNTFDKEKSALLFYRSFINSIINSIFLSNQITKDEKLKYYVLQKKEIDEEYKDWSDVFISKNLTDLFNSNNFNNDTDGFKNLVNWIKILPDFEEILINLVNLSKYKDFYVLPNINKPKDNIKNLDQDDQRRLDPENYITGFYKVYTDKFINDFIENSKVDITHTRGFINEPRELSFLINQRDFLDNFKNMESVIHDLKRVQYRPLEKGGGSFLSSDVSFDNILPDLISFFRKHEFRPKLGFNSIALNISYQLIKLYDMIYHGQTVAKRDGFSSIETIFDVMNSEFSILNQYLQRQETNYFTNFKTLLDLETLYKNQALEISKIKSEKEFLFRKKKAVESELENKILSIKFDNRGISRTIKFLQINKNKSTYRPIYVFMLKMIEKMYRFMKNYHDVIKNEKYCVLDYVGISIGGSQRITDFNTHYKDLFQIYDKEKTHWGEFFKAHKDIIVIKYSYVVNMEFEEENIKDRLLSSYFSNRKSRMNIFTREPYFKRDTQLIIKELKILGNYLLE